MKKAAALFLVIVIMLGLMACGSQGSSAGEGNGSIDMSKYPSGLDEWTGQNFIDYFTEAGIFTEGGGAETWLQDHATYWPGTPVDECAGWWDDMSTVMILIMSPDNADTSQEQLDEWKTIMKETKNLPEEYFGQVDFLVGNVAFSYSEILDEDLYNRMDAACKELFDALGVTPET